jgi:hypothetical protein
MQHEVRVGVFDWGRFGHSSGYYPEDLPAEWRLGFFANDFSCACLRLADFNQAPELLEGLLEDLPAEFDLSWFVDTQAKPSMIELAVSFDPFALILDPIATAAAPKSVSSRVNPSAKIWRLTQEQLRKDATSVCGLSPRLENLRAQREWIEHWMKPWEDLAPTRRNLWLDAADTDPGHLSELRLLVEMMGY